MFDVVRIKFSYYLQVQLKMSELEHISPGISREWHNEARISAYKVTAINPTTLDVWSKNILETLENWPKPAPIGIIFDLSSHGVGIPYLSLTRGNIFNIAILRVKEANVIEIMHAYPGFRIWFALVLSDSSLGNYMLNKGKAPASGFERIEHKVFFSSDAGIQWLTEVMQSDEQVAANDFGAWTSN